MKIIYTATMTIGNLFKFKDKIPKPPCYSTVYKFSFDKCNAIYVGEKSSAICLCAWKSIKVSPIEIRD